MDFVIYKDGREVNRIVADEAFCERHYSKDGYSYKAEPPMLAADPAEPAPTEQEDMASMLVDHEYRLTLMELGLLEGGEE